MSTQHENLVCAVRQLETMATYWREGSSGEEYACIKEVAGSFGALRGMRQCGADLPH